MKRIALCTRDANEDRSFAGLLVLSLRTLIRVTLIQHSLRKKEALQTCDFIIGHKIGNFNSLPPLYVGSCWSGWYGK